MLEVARASGSLQLIAGQVADLEGEGKKLGVAELRYIHERKTSALLCCAVRLGGMSANCTPAQLTALTDFGYHVGLAFQIVDDVLDVEASSEELGKTAGKDAAQQKITFPAVYGLEKSRSMAEHHRGAAYEALEQFGDRAARLRQLADLVVHRKA